MRVSRPNPRARTSGISLLSVFPTWVELPGSCSVNFVILLLWSCWGASWFHVRGEEWRTKGEGHSRQPRPDRRCRTSTQRAQRQTDILYRCKDTKTQTDWRADLAASLLLSPGVEDQKWGMLWQIYLPFPVLHQLHTFRALFLGIFLIFFVPPLYADVSGLGAKPARWSCAVFVCTDCFVLGEGWGQLCVCGVFRPGQSAFTLWKDILLDNYQDAKSNFRKNIK